MTPAVARIIITNAKPSHLRSLSGIWKWNWGRNQSSKGHPHTPQNPQKVDRRNPATMVAQKFSRMNLLTMAAVSLHVPHTHTFGAIWRRLALALQLTAFLRALATNSSTALRTGILTPPVLRDDTPSSTLPPLFAWHSLCDVRKEPEEKGCHLERRQAGHWDVSAHITALSFTSLTPMISIYRTRASPCVC